MLADGAGVLVLVDGAAGGLWVAFGAGAVEPDGAGVFPACTLAIPSNRQALSNRTILLILIMIDFSQMVFLNHSDGGEVLVVADAAGVGALCMAGGLWVALVSVTGA